MWQSIIRSYINMAANALHTWDRYPHSQMISPAGITVFTQSETSDNLT